MCFYTAERVEDLRFAANLRDSIGVQDDRGIVRENMFFLTNKNKLWVHNERIRYLPRITVMLTLFTNILAASYRDLHLSFTAV